jgi:NADH-quinone oxidoreductase subunit M
MGAYGLLRVVAMLPQGALALQPLLVGIALVSILYGGLLAWRQTDLKAMIAYSSVSHMGVVVLGISALNEIGLLGATLQMVAHGLIAGALFLLIGLLYERTHTRRSGRLWRAGAGDARLHPIDDAGVAGGDGDAGPGRFRGRTACPDRRFERWGWLMLLASLGVLMSAAYAVRTIGQLFAGPVRPELAELQDLRPHEWVAAVPLAAGLLILGLQPASVIALMSVTIAQLSAIFTPN